MPLSIYFPCSLSLWLLRSLRGSLGTYGFTQKLCLNFFYCGDPCNVSFSLQPRSSRTTTKSSSGVSTPMWVSWRGYLPMMFWMRNLCRKSKQKLLQRVRIRDCSRSCLAVRKMILNNSSGYYKKKSRNTWQICSSEIPKVGSSLSQRKQISAHTDRGYTRLLFILKMVTKSYIFRHQRVFFASLFLPTSRNSRKCFKILCHSQGPQILSSESYERLQRTNQILVQKIVWSEMLYVKLKSADILNETDYERIESKDNFRDKKTELIQAIMRRSEDDVRRLREIFQQLEQNTMAKILSGGKDVKRIATVLFINSTDKIVPVSCHETQNLWVLQKYYLCSQQFNQLNI